jgi:hypothetical protein
MMTYTRLAVNGCGYMVGYAHGNGHIDLATMLKINNTASLAKSDSSNDRIIRTTLKDSYSTAQPTLYIIGLSFLGRMELPVQQIPDQFEGRWFSFQNSENKKFLKDIVLSLSEFESVLAIKHKAEAESIEDRLEDLMYKLLAMVDSLQSRGHTAIVFNTADDLIVPYLAMEKFKLLQNSAVIQGLAWKSVDYQFKNGVQTSRYDQQNNTPDNMKHPDPGAHRVLNDFLLAYLKSNLYS